MWGLQQTSGDREVPLADTCSYPGETRWRLRPTGRGGRGGGEQGLDSGDALKIKPGESPRRSDISEKKKKNLMLSHWNSRKPSVEVGEIEGGWGRRTQKVLLNV